MVSARVPESRVFSAVGVPFGEVEWGRTKVLVGADPSPGGVGTHLIEVKITEYPPGFAHGGHRHSTQIEILYILSGHGENEREDGTRTPIGPGDVVFVPENCFHGNHNPHEQPLVALVIKVPPTPPI